MKQRGVDVLDRRDGSKVLAERRRWLDAVTREQLRECLVINQIMIPQRLLLDHPLDKVAAQEIAGATGVRDRSQPDEPAVEPVGSVRACVFAQIVEVNVAAAVRPEDDIEV